MCVKNAKKASSELQKMQTTLSRNCCSKNAPKLSAVIHCLQWTTAKIALKMQWDFGHSGNLQNLQGNCLQCRAKLKLYGLDKLGGTKVTRPSFRHTLQIISLQILQVSTVFDFPLQFQCNFCSHPL